MPRRPELDVLVTEFIVWYILGTTLSSSTRRGLRQRAELIAIKPERLLELLVERRAVGGRGLTLSVVQMLARGFRELE